MGVLKFLNYIIAIKGDIYEKKANDCAYSSTNRDRFTTGKKH
jgi:hypothetical protein